MKGPGYWMFETGGRLRPAIAAYLHGDPLSEDDIAVIRAYLRQWIEEGAWRGPMIGELEQRVDHLVDRRAIGDWLGDAAMCGIDPL